MTPSLNQGEFIEATIRSVLDQGVDVEYLVADGGSTDRTIDVLRRYEGRLRWHSGPDAGQSDGVNKAIAATSGEIVGWLNADDLYAPGAIAAAAAALRSRPDLGMVYGGAQWVSAAGEPLGEFVSVEPFDLRRLLRVGNYIVQPTVFFRRAAFEAVGGLDASLHYVMDYDLWIRLGSAYPVAMLDDTIARVRVHAGTKTITGGEPRWAEMEEMIRGHGGPGLPAYNRLERAADRARRAGAALRGRQWQDARRAVGGALSDVAAPQVVAALASPRTWRIIRARRRREG